MFACFKMEKYNRARYPFLPETDLSYDLDLLVPATFSNSTRIGTQLIEIPQSAQLGNGSTTQELPSALLNIAIPNNTSTGDVLTCSIDARWVMGKYTGEPIQVI